MPTLTGDDISQDITMATGGVSHTLTYTTVVAGEITPANMILQVNGTQLASVDLLSKYIGQPFTFTPAGGSQLSGVFASGVVNLVSQPTTTSAPNPPPTSSNNVYYISGNKADNDGGIVKAGGTPVDTRIKASAKVYEGEREVVGSTIVDGNNLNKSVDAGKLAYNNQDPIAKKVTVELAGVPNKVLQSGAAQPQLVQSINKLNVLRTRRFTTAIRENKYNRYTGRFDAGYPVVAVDPLATDSAANPTRTLPGQLVYKTGAKVPVTSDYKSKTN